jgi:hypothetical protein
VRHLKPILSFCLCLAVLASSVTSEVARGQMVAGKMVQICADGQAISVMLDANGNPVDASQHCPDCLAVTGDLPPTMLELGQPSVRWIRMTMPTAALIVGCATIKATARGPPALI